MVLMTLSIEFNSREELDPGLQCLGQHFSLIRADLKWILTGDVISQQFVETATVEGHRRDRDDGEIINLDRSVSVSFSYTLAYLDPDPCPLLLRIVISCIIQLLCGL